MQVVYAVVGEWGGLLRQTGCSEVTGEVRLNRQENKRFRIRISALEADVAYFDARLALLTGPPSSCYQEAQIRAYRELVATLSEMLRRLQSLQPRTEKCRPLPTASVDEAPVVVSGAGG